MHTVSPSSFRFMFVRPVATLSHLGERPAWFFPLLVSALFSITANFYVIQRLGIARLAELVSKSNAVLDPEAVVQTALAHPYQIQIFQALSALFGTFLTAFISAKVIWLILTLLGREVRFKKVMATAAYVMALSAILRAGMLALTATLIRDLDTLDLRNPLATNPAFFLRPDSPAAFRLLSSIDALTILSIALLSAGLSKVCPRLPLRTASAVVAVPWMVYVGAGLLFRAG
jgi:hypothetical protein